MFYTPKDIQELMIYLDKLPKEKVIASCSIRGMSISLVEAMKSEDINIVQPVIFLKGFENSPINEDYTYQYIAVKNRIKELYGNSKELLTPIIFSDVTLWKLLNIRYATEIINKFGIYNPCLGCIAYFNILELCVALKNNNRIITSEKMNPKKDEFKREILGELMKNSIKNLSSDFNVELINPLEKYTKVYELKDVMGDNWCFIYNTQNCLFEKSWRTINDERIIDETKTNIFINDFLYPVSKNIINHFNINEILDEKSIKKIIINALIR